MCPICRSPLKPPEAATDGSADAGGVGSGGISTGRQIVDWAGGTLDELISLLSGPAWSARVEVLPSGNDQPVGEVHVIAGGVSDALYKGASAHDSLDSLRAAASKGARFRIEPRLPNPGDGSLATAGPTQGKLEERPLATLMRYCEDFVLSCGIEVWRGNESSKVDYRRGEIVGVTVGGIDAPERLAEVMKWASGSYRLLVPTLSLPASAPKSVPSAASATPASTPATSPAAAPATPRTTGPAANRTIFGMPAVDAATIAAASANANAGAKATSAASVGSAQPAPAATPGLSPSTTFADAAGSGRTPAARPTAPVGATNPARATLMGTPPAGMPAVASAAATSGVSTGVAAEATAASVAAGQSPGSSAGLVANVATLGASGVAGAVAPVSPGSTASTRQGANRTIFGIAPPVIPTASAEPAPAAKTAAVNDSVTAAVADSAKPAAEKPSASAARPQKSGKGGGGAGGSAKPARSTGSASLAAPAAGPAGLTGDDDRTSPARAGKGTSAKPGETAVWTYVGVGFVIGLGLLGVYRLVMVFAN